MAVITPPEAIVVEVGSLSREVRTYASRLACAARHASAADNRHRERARVVVHDD
jgi:hypothetical protein